MRSLYQKDSVFILFLISLCSLAYASLNNIPFLYYETVGIENNLKLIDSTLFWQSYFNLESLFYKPLTLLSYYLNHQLCGPSPACFHFTNFFIHLSNSVLVFFLAKKLKIEFYRFTSLIFALHPLSTACVSQIHGRPYSLATFFMLIALNVFFSVRDRHKKNSSTGAFGNCFLIVLFCLAILAKQTLVVFPMVLLFYAWFQSKKKRTFFFLNVSVIICLIFLSGMVFLDLLPNLSKAVVSPGTYFLSQLGNIITLIKLYVLPFQTALVHDLYFYGSIAYLPVIFGILICLTWLYGIFKLRSSLLGWLMFSFFILIIPSNSIIPKNEVIREWRLYPSLVFFSLLSGWIISWIYIHIPQKHFSKTFGSWIFYCFVSIYIGVQTLSVWQQNQIYSDSILTWHQVKQKYPYSSDAYNNIGVWHARNKNYFEALMHFNKAVFLDPKNFAYQLNIAASYRELGNLGLAIKHSKLAQKKAKAFNNKKHSFHLKP